MAYNAATGEMDFGLALKSLKLGNAVARKEWLNSGLPPRFVYMEHGKLYLSGSRKPEWFPWSAEILAEDWVEMI